MFICLNRIRAGEAAEDYERVYREGSDFMATLPGHVRHMLVRSDTEPGVYFSIAEWRSEEDYRAMSATPRVREIFDQLSGRIEVENHEGAVGYRGE
ncbi:MULTISPECIES: antibiotic biosynthesis monooxygenase [Nocardiopsis]|uniref:antibiotic biosynthesis monooxygenase family protein n=1 Tax=Nocardiopsis TaxID=2013 RepID=UPI0003818B7F|nr:MULTISPECIES: antibiotic biosynthesis monooxygenase family protein [Nocardiopsis]